jgi:UDP-N-acetyl-2-amino-2-deoxyglucuronate dehydrogenase
MLHVAVVGCGVIGPVHAAAVELDTGAALRWACDLDPTRLPSVQAARRTSDAAEVFADPSVDLVCVCTQHPAHAGLVEAALAAGKHVLCEKPLASTPRDLRRIVDAASAHPRLIASGVFQHRYAPLARRLRQLVAEGAFGTITTLDVDFACTRNEPYYAADSWRGKRIAEGGGVAINQGIHTIDLGLWLVGAEVRQVSGRVRRRRLACIEVEDLFEAQAICSGGLVADLRADNDGVTPWKQRIVVRGSRGSFTLGDGHRLEAVEHTSGGIREELQALDTCNFKGKRLGGGKDVYGYHHALQVADVLEAIRTGRRPMVTVADAMQTNAVVLAAYQSTTVGGPVELPLDPATYSYPDLALESSWWQRLGRMVHRGSSRDA